MERYETYKDSGVEWIGEIPADWKIAPLKTLASIVAGQSPSNDDVADEGSLPFLQGKAEFGTIHPYPVHYCDRPKKVAGEGSILMSVRAPVGEINVADQAYGIGRGLCAIESETIDSVFLRYALSVSDSALRAFATGTTFEAVTAGQIGNLPAVVPSSGLDSIIADFIDTKTAEIDALVADCEREVGLLQEYRKAVITEAVAKGLDPDAPMKDSGVEWIGEIPEGWSVGKLRHLGTTQNGISKGGEYFGSGHPFVSYGNVYRNELDRPKLFGLIESTEDERARYGVRRGDVLFTRTSETIEEVGIAACALTDIGDCCFAGFLIRFRPNDGWGLIPEYASYYFRSDLYRPYLTKEMVLVTRASLSQQLIGGLAVLKPPIEEQQSIVAYLDEKTAEIDFLISSKQRMADKLREYRRSLISEAVTGKFKVPGV